MEVARCLYCSAPPNSLEHPLPAAFGEFKDAPLLKNRICNACNNTRLGILDEQLTRCGPEALLRRFYGVEGRARPESVNIFERPSAGGHRLDLKAKDPDLGIEVALEIENGVARQMRQIVFVEKSGKTHHLLIREDSSPDRLRAEFDKLGVVQPFDVHLFCGPEEKDWVDRLLKETWPAATWGEGKLGSTTYPGAVGTVVLTNRYFRALAKIGFHYFLAQFPEYTGHEEMFSEIRKFIVDDSVGMDRVNTYVGKRERALLWEMLTPGVRPNGWKAHVLCAETEPGKCVANVQLFVSENWPAPIYTIRLAEDAAITESSLAGHAYMYYGNGREGNFSGDAFKLEGARADWPAPPLAPVIMPA